MTLVDGLVKANAPTETASFAVAGASNPPLGSAVAARELADTLDEPTPVLEDENISVSAISVDHFQVAPVGPMAQMPRAVAYRIVARGRTFVYSGDTGPSPMLGRLARDADVLFAEVIDLPAVEDSVASMMVNAPPAIVQAMVRNLGANHLAPEVIGELATEGRVKRVVLTHFVAALEAIREPQSLIERVRSKYHGSVDLAHDLERF